MNNKVITVFYLLCLSNVVTTCRSNHANKLIPPSKECVALNNKGFDNLMNYPMNGENGLDSAITMFTKAIKCDSSYLIPYINLTIAYDHKHNYNQEMIFLNKILILRKNDPLFLTNKGMLFEKINQIDSAKKIYSITKARCEKILLNDTANVNIIKDLVLLKALTDGKDEAVKEITEQIKMHPNLSSELSGEFTFYKDFDRHAFIYGLTTEGPPPPGFK